VAQAMVRAEGDSRGGGGGTPHVEPCVDDAGSVHSALQLPVTVPGELRLQVDNPQLGPLSTLLLCTWSWGVGLGVVGFVGVTEVHVVWATPW
jgi:hypothetical protein